MWILSVSFLALFLTALSQATGQPTAAEQSGLPPAAERVYSKKERVALCKKKQNAPLAPSEPPPQMAEGKVTRPKIIHRVNPVHASSPIAGKVILEAVIDVDGCVRDPRILRGINQYQSSEILDAVRQWVFLPATRDGEPVSVYYSITFGTQRGAGGPP